ncbi:MAG TPA: DUF2007 domain-containing protein [Patescibacteria group bacterium]|nr:DUF2007 domain-containing protein [Patescibacteria group bacterium]
MQEIFRTSEPAEIAFVKSLLESAKIKYFVFGEHLTAALGGMLDNISDCRFMVLEEDFDEASSLLEDAGLFDPEEEFFEIFASEDAALAQKARMLLDTAGITYEYDEFRVGEDLGLIPGTGDGPVTHVIAARDSLVEEACDILANHGLIKPLEGNA